MGRVWEGARPVPPPMKTKQGDRPVAAQEPTRLTITDQLQQVAVRIEEVETLVVTPVDRGVVRDPSLGEQRLRAPVVVPRDLEGVVALAEGVRHLLEVAGGAVGFEEQRAAAVAVVEENLVGEPHPHAHAEDLRVEALGPRQVGDVHAEVIEPPDTHAPRIARRASGGSICRLVLLGGLLVLVLVVLLVLVLLHLAVLLLAVELDGAPALEVLVVAVLLDVVGHRRPPFARVRASLARYSPGECNGHTSESVA